MTLEELIDQLRSGKLDAAIGEIERMRLDFKGQRYTLDQRRAKAELAKDVSAMSNARGGLILLPVRTTQDDTTKTETATQIRPLALLDLDFQRYKDALLEWLYPRVDVELEAFPSEHDADRGLLGIYVPKARSQDYPHLVTKIFDTESNSVVGHTYAMFERVEDDTDHLGPDRFHSLVRAGLNLDQTIREQHAKTRAQLLSALSGDTPAGELRAQQGEGNTLDGISALIEQALDESQNEDRPVFVLWFHPSRPLDFPSFYQGGRGELGTLIDRPPKLRSSGFDLRSGARPGLSDTKLNAVTHRQTLAVSIDGDIVHVAAGDSDFLCWGQSRIGTLVLNQLVLVEATFLFVEFVKKAVQLAEEPPRGGTLGIKLSHMELPDGSHAGLLRGRLSGYNSILDASMLRGTEVQASEPIEFLSEPDSGLVAFKLIRQVYAAFGLEESDVPYTEETDDGTRRFSAEQLAQPKKS